MSLGDKVEPDLPFAGLPSGASLLVPAEIISAAIGDLARRLNDQYAGLEEPAVVLTVMNGGLVFAGQLLPKLRFPLVCDYLHASRYGEKNSAGDESIVWKKLPSLNLFGRLVIVLDDILDQGVTALEIRRLLEQQGATKVVLVMMVAKPDSCRRADIKADFVGMDIPDKFVFGVGMDYSGLYRNLPALYYMGQDV